MVCGSGLTCLVHMYFLPGIISAGVLVETDCGLSAGFLVVEELARRLPSAIGGLRRVNQNKSRS